MSKQKSLQAIALRTNNAEDKIIHIGQTRHYITTDRRAAAIKAGLKEGDRVVTVGNYQLKSSVQ